MPVINLLAVTVAACAWCLTILGFRISSAGNLQFAFLSWNLFLAAIPLGLALVLHASSRTGRWSLGLPLVAGWLLFFPNAPYVLTDLIHLRARTGVPLWFDLLMILSFALVSLWMGFQSLHLVQAWIARRTSRRLSWCFAGACMLLCGFGIYLGRFLRWNSWDIVSHPLPLLADIWSRVSEPASHPQTWGVTLGFGGLLMLGYLFWLSPATRTTSPLHAD
jgi:uncharacterized membrane protein